MSAAEPGPRPESRFESRFESTGDPAADASLAGLQGAGDLSPDDEAEAYRVALDALARLLEEQPRVPGAS